MRSPTRSGTRSPLPNDPYLSQLWAVQNTGQLIRGVAGTPDADSDIAEAWEPGITGNTIVAVIDTRRGHRAPGSPAEPPARSRLRRERRRPRSTRTATARTCPARSPRSAATAIGVAGVADNAAKVLPIRTLDSDRLGQRVERHPRLLVRLPRTAPSVVNLSLGGRRPRRERSATRSRRSRRCCSSPRRATAAPTAWATTTTSCPPTRARTSLPERALRRGQRQPRPARLVLELRRDHGRPRRAGRRTSPAPGSGGDYSWARAAPRWPRRT